MKEIKGFEKFALWMAALFLFLIVADSAFSNELSENITPVDYTQADNWLSIPVPVKQVDIFYLYPTVWSKNGVSLPDICDIKNVSMRTGAVLTFQSQATAFESVGNIYAPYYRQADVFSMGKVYYPNDSSNGTSSVNININPSEDVIAAFDYYLNHFNNGRPFIIVGHSQGSVVGLNLLSSIAKNHTVEYKRLIAAYLIGGHVTQKDLDESGKDGALPLKFATGPFDTGVIIQYNTHAKDIPLSGPSDKTKVDLVINPITWTRDETLAKAEQGLGSFMPYNNGVKPGHLSDNLTHFSKVPQYADAQVDKTRGVLLCSTADVEYPARVITPPDITINFADAGKRVVKETDPDTGKVSQRVELTGNFHIFDYWLYYFNIRRNAEERVSKFLHLY